MSQGSRSPTHLVEFGTFEVDLRSGEIRKAGVRVPLQEQPLRVLARLLRHPGELVTREELRQELWPDNTFLDFEHGLNAAIKRLRDALGDAADSPRFIETLPRRGYRFIAPVQIRGGGSEPTASPGETTPPAARQPARKWVAVLLLLLCGIAAAWWNRASLISPSSPLPGGSAAAAIEVHPRQVTVDVFENRSSDPGLDSLRDQVAGRVVRAIAQVPAVEAKTSSSLPAAGPGSSRRESETADAHTDGGPLLVTGALYVHADRLELQCRILDAASRRLLHALPPSTGPRADPGEAIERLEQRVAGAVAIHYDEFFGGLDVVSQPPTLDAYREYRAGLEIFSWDYPRALAHLQRALDADPEFWLPHVIMYFVYGNMGESNKDREQLALIERDRERRTPAERLFIDYLREAREGRLLEALQVLRDLEGLMPDSLVVNFNIVAQSLSQNRPREARDAYDRLPSDMRTLRHSIGTWRLEALTRALHLLGEHERELEESRRGQLSAPGMLGFIRLEVRALSALGRIDEVQAVAGRSLSIPATSGTGGQVLEEAARTLRAHGHREASLVLAARAVEWHRTQSTRAPNDETRATLAGCWTRPNGGMKPIECSPRSPRKGPSVSGNAGACAARRGDVSRARAISAELQRLSDPDLLGYHTYWRAKIAALLGEHPRAVDLLRQALAQGQVLGLWVHHDEDFESLRDYSPFLELVKIKD